MSFPWVGRPSAPVCFLPWTFSFGYWSFLLLFPLSLFSQRRNAMSGESRSGSIPLHFYPLLRFLSRLFSSLILVQGSLTFSTPPFPPLFEDGKLRPLLDCGFVQSLAPLLGVVVIFSFFLPSLSLPVGVE